MLLKPLSSSALIDLVVPGSPVTSEQIQEAVQQVEQLGFKARVPSDSDLRFLLAAKKAHFPERSSSDVFFNKKFQHLKKALTASDSEAVWCIRGGYGSQKIMPFLFKMKKPMKPKLFIGYSDATVLQIFFNGSWKWPVLHFPVLVHLKDCSFSGLQRFKKLVQGFTRQQSFLNLKVLNQKYTGSKKVSSRLTGGNFTLIQSSIGTSWAGSFQNKFLFLEDIGEAPYRLDRALWQMWNAGVFKGVKGVVLGDFISSDPKNSRWEIREVFRSFANRVSFPVVEGVPCGHGKKKEALPFLTSSSLKIQAQGKASLHIASPFNNKNL